MPWGEETPGVRAVRRAWWVLVATLWAAMLAVPTLGDRAFGPADPDPDPAPPPPAECEEAPDGPAVAGPPAQAPAQVASADEWMSWVASWYGDESGEVTASGERFDPGGLTAAHRMLPFGTRLEVCHGDRCVRVRVNDRGPYVAGRDLDLSRGAAEALGIIEAGVARVRVRVLPGRAR